MFLRRTLSGGRNGFTLIELLVVMAIIAIAFQAIRPSFAGALRSSQERTALRNLVGAFIAARSYAVGQGRLVRIAFDQNARYVYAEAQIDPLLDRSQFEQISLAGQRTFTLPEHLWLDSAVVAGQPLDGMTQIYIYFYPDGRTDGAALTFVGRNNNRISIQLAPATGRVKLDV